MNHSTITTEPQEAARSGGSPVPSAEVRAPIDRWLWALVVVTTAIKLVLAVVVDGQNAVLDEVAYLDLAQGIARTGAFEGTFRPPLYPAFMALFLALGGGTLAIRLSQVLLNALSVLLVYRVGAHAFGRRTARFAAAIMAFDPVLASFTHRLWSETLFIFLLLVMIERLLVAVRSGGWGSWVIAGLALGLAGLTRPMILTFAPLLLPWAFLQARHTRMWAATAVRFTVLTAACCAVVLPWTFRNYRVSGSFILVDTNGAFNFLVGTQREAAFIDKDDVWSEQFGRVAGQRYEDYVLQEPGRAQELAVRAARSNIADAPGRFVRKSFWEAGHLWTLDSFLLRHLRNGWYGGAARRSLLPAMTVAASLYFMMLVLGGILGLATTRPSPLRGLTLLLVVHSTLLFGLTYALSRYSVPLHPLLALFTAAVLSDGARLRTNLTTQPHRAGRMAVALLALLLVGSAWVRDLPMMADMITNRGAQHRFHYERFGPADALGKIHPVTPGRR